MTETTENSRQNPGENSGQNPDEKSGQNPDENSGQNPGENSGQNPPTGEEAARMEQSAGPSRPQAKSAAAAANRAASDSGRITIQGIGTIDIPSGADLAYAAGIATLAALGLLEWPIAAVLGIGHLLSQSKQSKTLRGFGEALDEA